jgi:hypothetical protein
VGMDRSRNAAITPTSPSPLKFGCITRLIDTLTSSDDSTSWLQLGDDEGMLNE